MRVSAFRSWICTYFSIKCNLLTKFIYSCNGDLVQPCLVAPETHFDSSVIQTELPNRNHERASIILILMFLLVLLFTLVAVSVFYIRKWQRRNRFFAHARLNENVEEITNPIFDYSAAIEADDAPVATTKFDGNNDKVNTITQVKI